MAHLFAALQCGCTRGICMVGRTAKRATIKTGAFKQIDDGLCTRFQAGIPIHLLQLFILALSLFAHGTALNELGSTVKEFHGLAMCDSTTALADSASTAGYYCTVTA